MLDLQQYRVHTAGKAVYPDRFYFRDVVIIPQAAIRDDSNK